MYNIDIYCDTPLYLQLVEQTKSMTIAGIFKDGDKLPSIRELSAIIGVNPATVAKAYAELEKEGMLKTSRGRGSFISTKGLNKADVIIEIKNTFTKVSKKALFVGVGIETLKKLLNDTFREVNNDIKSWKFGAEDW